MKTWRACLGTIGVFVVLTWQVTAQIHTDEFVQGLLRQEDLSKDEFDNPPSCSPGQLTVCIGCKKIKICIGAANDSDNPTQFCPTGKEHCNSDEGGVCSNIPDSLEECAASAAEFTCTASGKFPDPYSCDGYYYCETVGGLGDAYKCPTGYNYNSKVQLCQRVIGNNGECHPVNCTGITAIFSPYPSNPQYFYYCKADPADATVPKQPIMFTCGDGASFDEKENRCIFKCPREGLFKKEGSPASYYQCFFSGGRLVAKEKQCPGDGQVFDDTKKICLKTVNGNYRKQLSSG